MKNIDKVIAGIPYKKEGNKYIITEPLDDNTKTRIINRAKKYGYKATPNMVNGVTIW